MDKSCDCCIHVQMCKWKSQLKSRGCGFYDNGSFEDWKWVSVDNEWPKEEDKAIFLIRAPYNYEPDRIEVGCLNEVLCSSNAKQRPSQRKKDRIKAWLPFPKIPNSFQGKYGVDS